MNEEFRNKIDKIRKIMSLKNISAVIINNQCNFSWLTGGRGFIGIATEKSCCSVLVTEDNVFFVTNNIEAQRLKNEELIGLDGEYKIFPWYDESQRKCIIGEIVQNGEIVDDDVLASVFRELRSVMCDSELERYRSLGLASAKVVEKVARELKQGCTEFDAWGMLAKEALFNGLEPVTVLVGFDGRVFDYRHPLPNGNKLEKYAMLVTVFRKWGLHASCTRFVSFVKPDDEIKRRFQAVATVDASFITNTRPGKVVGDIFKDAMNVYEQTGFANEWQNHHQGGLTGYSGREYRAFLKSLDVVAVNQVYAWNPSISGTKSEDTIIVGENRNEIITHTGEYEYIEINYNGNVLLRPYILVR